MKTPVSSTTNRVRLEWSIIGGVLALLLVFMYIIPLHTQTGIIDTMKNICLGNTKTTVKKYHLLLGQLRDYHLVEPHILTANASATQSACGQRAQLRLYL